MKKRIITIGLIIIALCVTLIIILNFVPKKTTSNSNQDENNIQDVESSVPIVEDKTFFPEIIENNKEIGTEVSQLSEKDFSKIYEKFNNDTEELSKFSAQFYDNLKSSSSESIENKIDNFDFKNWSIIIGNNNTIDIKYIPNINSNKMSKEQITIFTNQIKDTMENFLLASRTNFIKDSITINIFLDDQLAKVLKTN